MFKLKLQGTFGVKLWVKRLKPAYFLLAQWFVSEEFTLNQSGVWALLSCWFTLARRMWARRLGVLRPVRRLLHQLHCLPSHALSCHNMSDSISVKASFTGCCFFFYYLLTLRAQQLNAHLNRITLDVTPVCNICSRFMDHCLRVLTLRWGITGLRREDFPSLDLDQRRGGKQTQTRSTQQHEGRGVRVLLDIQCTCCVTPIS